jgi:hypothetical protein
LVTIESKSRRTIIAKLFKPQSFETGFLVVSGQEVQSGDFFPIKMPGGIRRNQLINWIGNKNFDKKKLPACQYPAWLGLPNNAEKVLLTTRGTDMVTNLLKMQLLKDDMTTMKMTIIRTTQLITAEMAAPHGCVYCRTHWLRCDRLSKSSKQIHKQLIL